MEFFAKNKCKSLLHSVIQTLSNVKHYVTGEGWEYLKKIIQWLHQCQFITSMLHSEIFCWMHVCISIPVLWLRGIKMFISELMLLFNERFAFKHYCLSRGGKSCWCTQWSFTVILTFTSGIIIYKPLNLKLLTGCTWMCLVRNGIQIISN